MGVSGRQKKTGGPYWLFISHHGKRKSKLIGEKSTANKIAEIIRGQLAANDLGIFKDKEKEAIIFKDIADQWLGLDIKERCRITTYNRYKSSLRMYVNPSIGKLDWI